MTHDPHATTRHEILLDAIEKAVLRSFESDALVTAKVPQDIYEHMAAHAAVALEDALDLHLGNEFLEEGIDEETGTQVAPAFRYRPVEGHIVTWQAEMTVEDELRAMIAPLDGVHDDVLVDYVVSWGQDGGYSTHVNQTARSLREHWEKDVVPKRGVNTLYIQKIHS